MDISQLPIAISLISLSAAIVKQSWDRKNGNGSIDIKLKDYVPREVCHLAMKNIADKQDVIKLDLDEIKQDVKTILKNGK